MPSGPFRGACAAVVLAALSLAACGGGGPQAGSSTPEQVTTQTRGSTITTTTPEPGAGQVLKFGKKGGAKSHAVNPAKKAPQVQNGVAVKKGAESGAGGAKKPKSSPPPKTSAAPEQSNKAIFGIARGMCSNPDLVKSVPDGIRGDDDAIATYAEMFAPQGQRQSAHDGCLAGLKSMGH